MCGKTPRKYFHCIRAKWLSWSLKFDWVKFQFFLFGRSDGQILRKGNRFHLAFNMDQKQELKAHFEATPEMVRGQLLETIVFFLESNYAFTLNFIRHADQGFLQAQGLLKKYEILLVEEFDNPEKALDAYLYITERFGIRPTSLNHPDLTNCRFLYAGGNREQA